MRKVALPLLKVTGGGPSAGLVGSTRRYVLLVTLLAVLATAPLYVALSFGVNALGQNATSQTTTPFIRSPNDVPIVIVGSRPQARGVESAAGCRSTPYLRWRALDEHCLR
ncbi:hypothetical protein [Pilimelia columellifera]|uniref:Uncharacterized protein n=1 Tax=Pilimelia columellifera subsp. columellifera TaxID=706583 RepID=A0ABN3N143_9ACTN